MNFRAAISDVTAGAGLNEFWMTYGLNDIKAKYRRSKLGQWWITLSVAIFIVVIGGFYRGVFKSDDQAYLLYLALGYILWLFISDTIVSACTILMQAKPFLMQRRWPVSTFVYRLLYRETLILLHHIVILPILYIWLKKLPSLLDILIALLGFGIILFTAFWVALFFSIITLRYRDIPPIIQSLLRMFFFITPIIWVNRDLGEFGTVVANLNPFGYYINIVRTPLLGGVEPASSWYITISLGLLAMAISLTLLANVKTRISYWL